jgi:hypothetical protein
MPTRTIISQLHKSTDQNLLSEIIYHISNLFATKSQTNNAVVPQATYAYYGVMGIKYVLNTVLPACIHMRQESDAVTDGQGKENITDLPQIFTEICTDFLIPFADDNTSYSFEIRIIHKLAHLEKECGDSHWVLFVACSALLYTLIALYDSSRTHAVQITDTRQLTYVRYLVRAIVVMHCWQKQDMSAIFPATHNLFLRINQRIVVPWIGHDLALLSIDTVISTHDLLKNQYQHHVTQSAKDIFVQLTGSYVAPPQIKPVTPPAQPGPVGRLVNKTARMTTTLFTHLGFATPAPVVDTQFISDIYPPILATAYNLLYPDCPLPEPGCDIAAWLYVFSKSNAYPINAYKYISLLKQ